MTIVPSELKWGILKYLCRKFVWDEGKLHFWNTNEKTSNANKTRNKKRVQRKFEMPIKFWELKCRRDKRKNDWNANNKKNGIKRSTDTTSVKIWL